MPKEGWQTLVNWKYIIFWDDSECLGLKQRAKESRRLHVLPYYYYFFNLLIQRLIELHPERNAFLPFNVWKCWKPFFHKSFPQPLTRLAILQTLLYGKLTVCLCLCDTPWNRGNLRILGGRQFIFLASTDPSPLLQSFHFTSESKVGLTMKHGPSLPFFFSSCQSEKWLGGSSNYVEHVGTVFMPKKIGVTTVLEADEVMLWWPEKGVGWLSSSNKT